MRQPVRGRDPALARRFPSRTLYLTKGTLHDLQCTDCHRRGHESADCFSRARHACIFYGSSNHRHGVECDQPALYDHYVLSGTVRAFQRKTPSQRRLALNGQHWRDAYTRS